jgi:redox-sensitive bicupin YhaK (pirin superfamily)
MSTRTVQSVIPALATSDGAGVKLARSLGQGGQQRLDPFLMLDEFGSENPGDYIAGFPAHPHRGFETVTYMLDGHMQHKDHLGNVGELKSGGVQWMTAARGIIHSEMPQQEAGRMRGFQLWINLPAAEKMKPASYKDIQAADIPEVRLAGASTDAGAAGTGAIASASAGAGAGAQSGLVRVIAGDYVADGVTTAGPIQGLATQAIFFDVHLPAGAAWSHALPEKHNAFVYLYEGGLELGAPGAARKLAKSTAAILSPGDRVEARAGADGARFILLAARPLNEPVVQYGPFVMNTREEINQALQDYASGRLASA